MPRVSKIARLPKAILDEVHRAISRQVTVDQITALLASLGVDEPRSNVARYSKNYRAVVENERQVQSTIAALANDVGPLDDKMVPVLIQLVAGEMTRSAINRSGEGKELNPFELKQWTGSLKDIAATQNVTDARVRAARKEAFEEAQKLAETTLRKGGALPETLAAVRLAFEGAV